MVCHRLVAVRRKLRTRFALAVLPEPAGRGFADLRRDLHAAFGDAEDDDRFGGRTVSRFFILSACILWFVYSTDETSFLVRLYGSPAGARIAVSLLWGAYALALLAFGILRKKKIVRIPALVLFAVTVLKIFFFDLVGTPALYRIAGCMITGAVLVAGAWLYARFAQKGDASDENRP
ncbi:MAG: DUF2339 domain-containing protein [Lentisphaeria bacterium]|nr:DUF2339 domain-containing protein [Lentisphaeria bacterium]